MLYPHLQQAKILIVDDEKANIRLVEMMLQGAGYTNVYSTADAREAVPLFLDIQPDIVLLDLAMPYLDGFAVMAKLLAEMKSAVPILVLTADVTLTARHRALKEGAKDFLTKPLDEVEVLLRINNLLENRFHSVLLEKRVRERTEELEKAQMEILQRLALAAEYRDDDTRLHTRRVGMLAQRIAQALDLPPEQTDLILHASPLHDVGKIGIPDSILLKHGKLTDDEFTIMKEHTIIGGNILSKSNSSFLRLAEEITMTHHERWDGTGYPSQLAGEEIPLVGRIVSVADVFDALTHDRPYKRAWTIDEAISEIKHQSGRQFDPAIVQAFLKSLSEESI
jgi:putative two-component system response regulator